MNALNPEEIERAIEEDRRKIKELQEERAREAAAKEAAERAERQRRAQEALQMLQGQADGQGAEQAEAAQSKVQAKKAEAKVEAEAPARPSLPAEHTVQPGDTLSAIALKYYGNAALWPEIFKANKSIIGNDPGKIFVGQKLHIPKLD